MFCFQIYSPKTVELFFAFLLYLIQSRISGFAAVVAPSRTDIRNTLSNYKISQVSVCLNTQYARKNKIDVQILIDSQTCLITPET